jgi:hypothetical protein
VDLDAFTSSVSTGGSRLGSRGMYVHIHIDVCIIHELIAAVLNELQETSSGRDESTNMLPRCGEMADTIGLQCSLHIAGKMSWQDWLKDAEEYSRQRLFSRYQRSQLAIKERQRETSCETSNRRINVDTALEFFRVEKFHSLPHS